jgi:hypothetical protein
VPARFAASILLTVFASACTHSDTELAERIAEAVAQAEGTTINMSQIAEFEWDRFFVFPPYIPYEEIDRQLGFPWPSAESTGIHQLDSFTLLVFTRGVDVVAYVELPRRNGDFSEINRDGGFSREAAVFAVDREYRGEPWLVLREVARPAA